MAASQLQKRALGFFSRRTEVHWIADNVRASAVRLCRERNSACCCNWRREGLMPDRTPASLRLRVEAREATGAREIPTPVL